ncbi:MAG: winged helix-turn-helix transcriptional regulator [Acidimicrobiia bacterium]|nr:winged helix-turn-helix transcriptional regulator [Acidimicrobiia bacterium]
MDTATFTALGEPSRLRIVELLRGGSQPVGVIAETLGIRQPQASKHLKVLNDAGLVTVEPVAKQRFYRLHSAKFDEMAEWLGSFETLWADRLDSLGRYLAAQQVTDRPDRSHP